MYRLLVGGGGRTVPQMNLGWAHLASSPMRLTARHKADVLKSEYLWRFNWIGPLGALNRLEKSTRLLAMNPSSHIQRELLGGALPHSSC